MAKNNAQSVKVVVTGPESSGKTTLVQALANHFQTSYVPEFAREYLLQKQGAYSQEDLVTIAKGQVRLEEEHLREKPKLLLCDTGLEVIRVWYEWKYRQCHPFILAQAKKRAPELYLLLTPDIPWQPDPLRENPDDRQALFARYQRIVAEYAGEVQIISGNWQTRLARAINAIDNILPG